jgi:hypothetical protein
MHRSTPSHEAFASRWVVEAFARVGLSFADHMPTQRTVAVGQMLSMNGTSFLAVRSVRKPCVVRMDTAARDERSRKVFVPVISPKCL